MSKYTTNFEYRQLNSKNLVVSEDYQRRLHPGRVKMIVANFDESLVNPIKVSHRDGKYFVFDGQHTLAALKLRNGNQDLMVDCKVYEGLSLTDEALLFSQQNGISRQVETIAKFRALHIAGDAAILELLKLTETAGLRMNFSKSKATGNVIAVAKAYSIFKSVFGSDYVDILSIIREAWNGEPESLCGEILGGMHVFHTTYKGKYDRKTLVKQLSRVSPITLVRDGKVSSRGGDTRFARQIYFYYNKNLSTKRLTDEFQGGFYGH